MPLNETYQPADERRLGQRRAMPVKQCSTPRTPAAPASRTIAAVSSSASRVCTTTGRSSSRASAELRRERAPLQLARRVIVVVVETALADRDGAAHREHLVMAARVARRVELGGVVRVNAGGELDEPADARRQSSRARCAAAIDSPMQTIADRAGGAGALDHLVAVGVERRIGEVGVAVDEASSCKWTNRRARRRFVRTTSVSAVATAVGRSRLARSSA